MPLISQYAHGRAQLPFTSANLTVSTGGTVTTPRTLYFCLQGENPVGYNLPSTIVGPLTIHAGEQLTLTLTEDLYTAGERWTAFNLSASESNTPSSFVQLARVPCFDSSDNRLVLPASLVLSTDEAFKLSVTVADSSALPTAGLVPGMRRGVFSLGFVYEYDPRSNLPTDGVETLAATLGRWGRVGAFTNAVTDTAQAAGCAQDIQYINELVVRAPRYAVDNSNGTAMGFWLANTGTQAIPSGQRVMIAVLLNEIPRSATFEGLLWAHFRGYANLSTGLVRTTNADGSTMRGLDTPIQFENKKTDLLFEDDLQPGEAYWLDLYPRFLPEYLNNGVVNQTRLKILCSIAPQAGAFAEGGGALGDRIYAEYDRGLCVPIVGAGVQVLKRSGLVNSRAFLAVGPTNVSPLLPNTAGQQIRINGNGAVYLGSGSVLDTEATRAVVDLLAGVSNACPLSAPVFVEGVSNDQALSVTLAYPSNGTTATVRADYPDPLLAGSTKAKLNALYVTLYVSIGSVIKQFTNHLVVDGATQTIVLDDWNAGTVITAIPGAPNARFCLFEALSASAAAVSGGANFPDGNATVAFAFQYDGTTVSAISHARADGCLHTAVMDLADVEEAIQYWGPAVATFAALPATGALIGQLRQTLDTGALYRWTGTLWLFATTPAYWGDPVANFAALPVTGVPPGQVRLTLDHGRLYRFNGAAWLLASGGGGGGVTGILNAWRLS